MKRNRPPHPPLESAGNGTLAATGSRKTMAGQTAWQGLATAGSLGFTLVGCTFLGLFAGYYLDRWLKTSPWFTILFLLIGIAAGFLNIFVSVSHSRPTRRSEKDVPQIAPDQNR
ncbi:MAG: AtpZ/AtpI family protein [Kiritimatiellaeota bacterium]|nr:AtpZ/AtpI family protein [Kiritimatiellota bacterium]